MKGLLGKATISVAILSIVLISIFVVTFVLPSKAYSGSATCTATGSYNVCTDYQDYSPEENVTITGSGFANYTQLLIKVTRPDGTVVTGDGTFTPGSDTITTDSSGNFQYNYDLDGVVGQYLIEVLDSENNVLANNTFTDALSMQMKGSDGSPHTQVNNEENLGSFQQGTSISLICPRGTGLTANVNGNLGSDTLTWKLVYVNGYGSNSILSSITNLTPNTGPFTKNSDPACVAMTINTNSLSIGTNYHGELNLSGSGVSATPDFYFFKFNVTPSVLNQAITVTTHALASAAYGSTFLVAATASSDLTVAITTSGSCSGSGSGSTTITMTSATGTCTVHYNQAGNASYNAAPEVTELTTAQKSDQTITFGSLSDKTYGNADFSVSATADSGLAVSFAASGNCSMADATNVHITGAGSCTITASQSGNSNYSAAPNVSQSFTINKANATINVTAYDVTYDGNEHITTGTATGVFSEGLNGLDLSATNHTNASNYTDSWTFTDVTGDYNNASGTVHDVINKTNATITVNGYTGVYDGNAHGATGSAIGVGGVNLSGSLNLGDTFTDVPGGTSHWMFSGETNYNDAEGDVAITINRADANVTVIPYNVTYDATEQIATGTATGVLNESLSGLDLTATKHTDAGNYTDSWTFTDVTGNYNNANGTVNDVINKKAASVTPDAKTKVYGDSDPALTGTTSGFINSDSVTASYSRTPGETVSGSPYTISATLSPAGVLSNYNITYNTANFTITSRPITVTADAKTKVYGESDPALTYKITSGSLAFNDTFTGSLSRTAGENVGKYAINQNTLALSSNYNLTYVGANLNITVRPVTITADNKSKILGAADPALTYQITSGTLVNGDTFSGSLTRDLGESVGTYAIRQGTLNLSSNYNLTYVGANLSIIYATVGLCLGSPGHQILQPINSDGTSLFKQKSTVPAKFRVCDVNGVSIGTPGVVSSFRLVGISNDISSTVNETVDSTTPDLVFRWSPTDQQWIFNMNTKNLYAGLSYTYAITLNDGSTIPFSFALK